MGCGSSANTAVQPLTPEEANGDEDETGSKIGSRGDSAVSKGTTDSGVVMENKEITVLPGAVPGKLPPLTSGCVRESQEDTLTQDAASPGMLQQDSTVQDRQKSSEILEELLNQGIIAVGQTRERSKGAGEAYSIMATSCSKRGAAVFRSRLTLPALSNNKGLLTGRPQLPGNTVLKLDEAIACTLGEGVSRVKDTAECRLHEKQLYSQLISDCLVLNTSLSRDVLAQDHILIHLKKEEQLTNETRELLQKQIRILLDKLSSLKEVRTQLLADFQDKGQAIEVTTKCIKHRVNPPSSRLPAAQYKPDLVSYDKWLSHCRELRLMAGNLIKDSSTFRGNLRFTLANMKIAQERQRRSTTDSLRREINELSKVQNKMMWERKQMKDEISDLTKDIQKLTGQIWNCDSKLHQATQRLDILNQRPGREHCLDQPYISLTLEKHDLAKMVAGLNPVLKRSQRDLKVARRRLKVLEDKLVTNAHNLNVEQKCQNLHQSFLPALDTTVVLAKKATGRSSPRAYLQ
ncbi:uncharacterized protein LOC120786420 [Xiphias gladius]|uniref:uncharacterized protein LOC120786420 n=1 Tax=Xiphias gladius TaxID=8245 RepID=UPI001A99E516|nr:uncharacterized protein LOC120786420 [Xiphias gladius]